MPKKTTETQRHGGGKLFPLCLCASVVNSKLKEMLRERKPPGFGGIRLDPQGPDAAIPRALRTLEKTQSAREISRGAGWSVDTLKRTWKI